VHPDIIHLTSYGHGQLPFLAPRLVALHGCKLTWWRAMHPGEAPPHSLQPYLSKVGCGLRSADATVCASRSLSSEMESLHGPFTSSHIIPEGREARDFRPGRKEDIILASAADSHPAGGRSLEALA